MDVAYLRPALAYYIVASFFGVIILIVIRNSLVATEVLRQSMEPFRAMAGGFLLLSVAIAATAPHRPWVLWILWAMATVGIGLHTLMMSWKPNEWHTVSTLFSVACVFVAAVIAFAGTFS